MTNTKKVCTACNGFGHDKAGRPVVKFETYKKDDGTKGKKHVTVSQGSGCINCGGVGHK